MTGRFIYGKYGAAVPANLPEAHRAEFLRWLESLGGKRWYTRTADK